MAWIALSAVEVDDLRGLLAHAGEVVTVEVVDRLRRRFGDASPVEQTQVTTLGGPANPGLPGPAAEGGGRPSV